MKLIKIEIEGFKSFAEPVSIKFDGSIVGIIGPNGSGKSNINDAIKWVLGEKSVKQLRAKIWMMSFLLAQKQLCLLIKRW
ncbi:Chromosome partition protein Smc [Mesomycoplasma hyopneumoniae]|uniref:Chromosome partition protein Smc n=1 Tax=Mesomycoplasma hyopneumoniae TaxID=2099 RepID=A0A223M9C6_MESHO|nr:Chromosome partition protein Smc [Mesomycoplasma hyopneumoniae]